MCVQFIIPIHPAEALFEVTTWSVKNCTPGAPPPPQIITENTNEQNIQTNTKPTYTHPYFAHVGHVLVEQVLEVPEEDLHRDVAHRRADQHQRPANGLQLSVNGRGGCEEW